MKKKKKKWGPRSTLETALQDVKITYEEGDKGQGTIHKVAHDMYKIAVKALEDTK